MNAKNNVVLVLFSLLFVNLFSRNVTADYKRGLGVEVLNCNNQYELVATKESIDAGFTYDNLEDTNSVFAATGSIISKLRGVDQNLALNVQEMALGIAKDLDIKLKAPDYKLGENTLFLSDVNLVLNTDYKLKENCKMEQLAIYNRAVLSEDKIFIVDAKLLSHLSIKQKALVSLLLSSHYYFSEFGSSVISQQSRKLVSWFASDQFKGINFFDYALGLSKFTESPVDERSDLNKNVYFRGVPFSRQALIKKSSQEEIILERWLHNKDDWETRLSLLVRINLKREDMAKNTVPFRVISSDKGFSGYIDSLVPVYLGFDQLPNKPNRCSYCNPPSFFKYEEGAQGLYDFENGAIEVRNLKLTLALFGKGTTHKVNRHYELNSPILVDFKISDNFRNLVVLNQKIDNSNHAQLKWIKIK